MFARTMFDWGMSTSSAVSTEEAHGVATGGLMAETKIASDRGWARACDLKPGDKVLTFDKGLQPLVDVQFHEFEVQGGMNAADNWPLLIPAGALGNKEPAVVLAGQSILVESDLAEEIYDDPFVAIPANALDGANGVSRVCPNERLSVVTLHFDRDHAVFGAGGVMFVCSAGTDLLDAAEPASYRTADPVTAEIIVHEGI